MGERAIQNRIKRIKELEEQAKARCSSRNIKSRN